MGACHHCGRKVKFEGKMGRQELCPFCRSDLHCCLNCTLDDEYAQNQCREPSAEWVSDRERNNFCEFFAFGESAGRTQAKTRDEARAKLEGLFKKKS